MTVHAISNASIGPGSERPPADNPTGGVSTIPFGLFIDSTTGTVYETTGEQWVPIGQLPAGTPLPGVTSPGPGGMIIGNYLQVGDQAHTSTDQSLACGFFEFTDELGNIAEGWEVVRITQGQDLQPGNFGTQGLVLNRNASIAQQDYVEALFECRDLTASAQPLAVFKKSGATQLQVDGDGVRIHGKVKVGSAVTHTLGAYSGKSVPIYDESGVLTGYMPLYA